MKRIKTILRMIILTAVFSLMLMDIKEIKESFFEISIILAMFFCIFADIVDQLEEINKNPKKKE